MVINTTNRLKIGFGVIGFGAYHSRCVPYLPVCERGAPRTLGLGTAVRGCLMHRALLLHRGPFPDPPFFFPAGCLSLSWTLTGTVQPFLP